MSYYVRIITNINKVKHFKIKIMKRLEGKVAFVAGASTGIGREVVKKFVEEGAMVAFTDINEVGQAIADEYVKNGREVVFIKVDATNEESVKSSVKKAIEKFGRIDIAANIVGGLGKADTIDNSFIENTTEQYTATKYLNEFSTLWHMQAQISQMEKQGGGAIVNTSSTASTRILLNLNSPSYTTSKVAVNNLTKYVALEYASKNIRVNAICPGATATELFKANVTGENLEYLEKMQPRGKIIEPGEVAEVYVFLCSDAASAISGVILPVDGAASL